LISAIVLAAGKSERMGRPKALLPIQGRTFLENILAAISRTSIEDAIVVLGHHRDEIERSVSLPSVVFNPDYEQGMITSFQAGIRKLSWDTTGAFLFLVDHPLVEPTTIESMIMNLAPNRIVLPTFERRRGHPVLFSSEVLEEILALAPSEGANIVVRKNPDRIIEVPVNAPGILVDIDTPEQFERLRKDYP
jgi:molybdenum cofactor cytidylyltransferase